MKLGVGVVVLLGLLDEAVHAAQVGAELSELLLTQPQRGHARNLHLEHLAGLEQFGPQPKHALSFAAQGQNLRV